MPFASQYSRDILHAVIRRLTFRYRWAQEEIHVCLFGIKVQPIYEHGCGYISVCYTETVIMENIKKKEICSYATY
jgi:hypothetical protein